MVGLMFEFFLIHNSSLDTGMIRGFVSGPRSRGAARAGTLSHLHVHDAINL